MKSSFFPGAAKRLCVVLACFSSLPVFAAFTITPVVPLGTQVTLADGTIGKIDGVSALSVLPDGRFAISARVIKGQSFLPTSQLFLGGSDGNLRHAMTGIDSTSNPNNPTTITLTKIASFTTSESGRTVVLGSASNRTGIFSIESDGKITPVAIHNTPAPGLQNSRFSFSGNLQPQTHLNIPSISSDGTIVFASRISTGRPFINDSGGTRLLGLATTSPNFTLNGPAVISEYPIHISNDNNISIYGSANPNNSSQTGFSIRKPSNDIVLSDADSSTGIPIHLGRQGAGAGVTRTSQGANKYIYFDGKKATIGVFESETHRLFPDAYGVNPANSSGNFILRAVEKEASWPNLNFTYYLMNADGKSEVILGPNQLLPGINSPVSSLINFPMINEQGNVVFITSHEDNTYGIWLKPLGREPELVLKTGDFLESTLDSNQLLLNIPLFHSFSDSGSDFFSSIRNVYFGDDYLYFSAATNTNNINWYKITIPEPSALTATAAVVAGCLLRRKRL